MKNSFGIFVLLSATTIVDFGQANVNATHDVSDSDPPLDVLWVKENLLAELGKVHPGEKAYRDDFLEGVARQVFRKFMSKSMFRESIIHDPTYVAKEIAFEKTVMAINVKVKAWDVNVHGLSQLRMTFLRVVRVNDLRDIKVLVKLCTDLHLDGKYSLAGRAIGILPLTGNGKFTIGFKDFCVAGITTLKVDGSGRQKTLKISELDAAVKSETVKFDFQNLMGGGSLGQTANNIVNTVGHTIMHTQKATLVQIIADKFHEFIAYYV